MLLDGLNPNIPQLEIFAGSELSLPDWLSPKTLDRI